MSDREITDFSLDALVLDIEAVINQLGLQKVAFMAAIDAGPVVIAYAARNPERVSDLVLWGTYAQGGFNDSTEVKGLFELMDRDWRLYVETVAHTIVGWRAGDYASRFAELMLKGTTPQAAKAVWTESFTFDVTSLLPHVQARTLVLHASQVRWADPKQAKILAAQIPSARLVVLDDVSGVLWWEESGTAIRATEEFLDEGARPPVSPALPSGTAIILFADIADSTALTERLGDAAFCEQARELDTALRTIIRDHAGTPIEGKLLGDGVLAVFTSARQAIEAALACGRAGEDAGLPLHLGLHAGDVIREENNVYGGAVNIASRIAGLSAAGEVLVSETVRSLARTSAGVTFEDRGEQHLKGVGEPVRVWAVKEGA